MLPRRHFTVPLLCLILVQSLLYLIESATAKENAGAETTNAKKEKDFRWPNKRLNVLIDTKTINETEQQILDALFDQIEHKTCVIINRLAHNINPFDPELSASNNFLYVFKSQFGLYNRHPSLGLSSFGCIQQGRQSLVLTDLAFRWPDLVLRYHLLRTLAVESLERPDGQVRLLLNMLPLSQKISNEEISSHPLAPFPSPFPAIPSSEPAHLSYVGVASVNVQASKMVARDATVSSQQPLVKAVKYLSEEDLNKIKQLYQCPDYQNKLSLKPLNELDAQQLKQQNLTSENASLYNALNEQTINKEDVKTDDKLETPMESILKVITEAEESNKVNDSVIDEAAKSIVDYLLSESKLSSQDSSTQLYDTDQLREQEKIESMFSDTTTPSSCKPLESCPIQPGDSATADNQKERPMLLKLDSFHASDPELRQANQMYLSQPAASLNSNEQQSAAPSTYRLMEESEWRQQQQQQQQQQQPQQQQQQQWQAPKTEMMISFEQADQSMAGNPVAALAGSKVLKLCSCTCQTMRPSPDTPPAPFPTQPAPSSTESHLPLTSDQTDLPGTSVQFNGTTLPANESESESELSTMSTLTTLNVTPTEPVLPTSEIVTEPSTTTTTTTTTLPETTINSEPPSTGGVPAEVTSELVSEYSTTIGAQNSTSEPGNLLAQSAACDQVEWVRPNKTVYASARIVWDLDRANQNYFLCNNMINGQLVPGKTHGFSCKISSEGKAYEVHNFNVLTKPEQVNLAWVQRNSDSFGITNLPVVGGFSKSQDPYIVSRCLVRDENNDVITLIGYVNNQGVGLFPFDDIQIECSQYDVLACVN